MRSILVASAVFLTALTLGGCASTEPTNEDTVSAGESEQTAASLPAGTFAIVDKPFMRSYVRSIKIAADQRFEIEFVLVSGLDERVFEHHGNSYDIFTDEGRRILAFRLADEENPNAVMVFELKAFTSNSLELASVGSDNTFEMRSDLRDER